MAFTTYEALLSAMLDAYADYVASGNFHVAKFSVDTGGSSRSYEYRDPDALLAAIERIKPLAQEEAAPAVGRTYAKQGGTGRWP